MSGITASPDSTVPDGSEQSETWSLSDGSLPPKTWGLSDAQLKERLQGLYPSVNMVSSEDPRVDHVRLIYILAGEAREEMMLNQRDGSESGGAQDVGQTTFGARVLQQIDAWRKQRNTPGTPSTTQSLPSHEDVLAFKLLTKSGDHSASAVETLKGTDFDHLLYPKTSCTCATKTDENVSRLTKKDTAATAVMEAIKRFIERHREEDVPVLCDLVGDMVDPELVSAAIGEDHREMCYISIKIREWEQV